MPLPDPRALSPLLHDPLFHHGLGQVGGKENITAISDVGVEAVILSCYLNGIVFLICGMAFEILRRWLPTVSDERADGLRVQTCLIYIYISSLGLGASSYSILTHARCSPQIYNGASYHKPSSRQPPPLPSSYRPSSIWTLWTTVHSVPWHNVLECAGLDAYMFLRYIRLCGRVTSVSAFWGMIILGTVYGTAGGGETGWYRMSMKNIPPIEDDNGEITDADDDAAKPINHQYDAENGLRLWVTVTFMYMLTFYVIYLLSEEYKHFVELRMVYLAKGDPDITPQHHYSLRIEDIPPKLKSEKSLFRYFEKLFPGKVHSVSVVLNIPEMDKVMGRRERVRRRLEKVRRNESFETTLTLTLPSPSHIHSNPPPPPLTGRGHRTSHRRCRRAFRRPRQVPLLRHRELPHHPLQVLRPGREGQQLQVLR